MDSFPPPPSPPPIPPAYTSPPTSAGALGYSAPHRGVLILVLGILGIVLCGICGIIAWIMGNADLRQMKAGSMDPAGRGLTEAGRICGIIATCLFALQMCFVVLWLLLVLVVGVSAAASGGRGGP